MLHTSDYLAPYVFCFLLACLIMGAESSVFAQVSGRGATSRQPVGASMAVLATLQDADVLPPEGTPEANRVIKVVIQFQSVFMKSDDPDVQAIPKPGIGGKGGPAGTEDCLDSIP